MDLLAYYIFKISEMLSVKEWFKVNEIDIPNY